MQQEKKSPPGLVEGSAGDPDLTGWSKETLPHRATDCQYPLTDFLEAALALHEIGIAALPCHNKAPLVRWQRYQDSLPSMSDLRAWAARGLFAEAVGVVIPRGRVVLDADDQFCKEAMDALRFRHSVITPSRGAHYYLAGDSLTTNLRKAVAGEVRGAGHFLVIPPTPGYLLRPGLDLLSAWQEAEPMPANLAARLPEMVKKIELRHYGEVVRGLSLDGTRGRGECPFHDDSQPSLSIYEAKRLGGRWAWCCHANCAGSGPRHGGDAADLLRLLHGDTRADLGDRVRVWTEAWNRTLHTLLARDLPMDVAETLLAVAKVGRGRDLDPGRPMGISYRVLAEALGLPGRWWEMRRRLERLEEQGLARVDFGKPYSERERGRPQTTLIHLWPTFVPGWPGQMLARLDLSEKQFPGVRVVLK